MAEEMYPNSNTAKPDYFICCMGDVTMAQGLDKTMYHALSNVLGTIFANTSDFMYVTDENMICLMVSDSFARYLGVSGVSDIIGKSVYDVIVNKEQANKYVSDSRAVLESGRDMLDFVETFVNLNGDTRHALTSKYAIRGEDGRPAAVLYVSRDVTREFEANEDYWASLQRLLNVRDEEYGVWAFDITTWRILEVRLHASKHDKVTSHTALNDFLSVAAAAVIPETDSDNVLGFWDDFSLDSLRGMYKSGQRRMDYEYQRIMADGSLSWVRLIVRLMLDPITDHLIAAFTLADISNLKNAQSDLKKAAEIDSMTGLFNHDATLRHIGDYLTGDGKYGTHALFMIDRDNLKGVNDNLGHQAGDDIICETARVLRSAFREDDIIGRVGGDEFLVLLKNADKPQTVHHKAELLLQSLQYIVKTAELTVESTGSIGISFYHGDNKTLDKLYAEADESLYKSKVNGRNRYTVYTQEDAFGARNQSDEQNDRMASVNLRMLLNSIDGGVLILHTEPGKELIPAFFSDSFLIMMGGLTTEEALELSKNGIFPCMHPDDRERVRSEYLQALGDGSTLRTTYRLVGKNGIYHWLSAGMNIISASDGNVDVYAVHTNIEELMHREEKLASDELRYRTAFSQTARLLFELDVASETITFYANGEADFMPESTVTGMPDAVIGSGLIHEDSAEAFLSFYQEMRSGQLSGRGLFKCRYVTSGQYGWTAISYQTILDNDGRAQKAIGSAEELPGITGKQNRLEREELLQNAVCNDLLFTLKANLSKNTVLATHSDGQCCFAGFEFAHYSEFASAVASTTSYQEDAMLLRLRLSRENIIDTYTKGTNWTVVEYRRMDGGEIRWTKIAASVIEDPVQRELCVFWYVSDVEKRRFVEAILPITTERDPVTHLYTQATFEKLVDGFMRGAGASAKLYSLSVIKVLGIPSLVAHIGAKNVEVEQMYLGRFLCALLDSDFVIGRYNDDCFLVFCADAQSDAWMRGRIEDAIYRIGSIRDNNNSQTSLTLVCGIATENAHCADLSGMLSQALRICDAYNDTETNKVRTFDEYVDTFRVTKESLEETTFCPVEADELNRPLFGSEKNALTACTLAMLAADSYDASMDGALGELGKYYGAQRVYILSLLSGNNAVSGLHEWTAPGKHSILRQLAGMSLDKLPMIKRVLTAARPIVMNNQGVRRNQGAHQDGSESPWCFIMLPIIIDNKIQGFLCIENPSVHRTDVALPNTLLPVFQHERARFGLNGVGMTIAGRDELTGLPDRSAYSSAMQSFNPDAWHAVGVIYVQALNLHELNRTKGVNYGDDMLVFAAQTLRDVCKKDSVFRMSGTDFAVISTNLTSDAFQGQFMRLQSILQRRYPRRFSFGHAWSDKAESARKLLLKAEGIARNGIPTPTLLTSPKERGDIAEIMEALQSGRFFVLLQPQVNMRTRKVVGAEVLARYYNKDNQIVLPSEFVHMLESAGSIRELDYFSLNQAFNTLQGWIGSGFSPVPLSVNFSRQTLLSSTALASVLAIQSRYDVPEELVEIEITESVGDCEPGAIEQAMERIRSQSFRFALDDLGSEYSSLKTLGDHTFDTIKLDKSLIDGFLYNSMSRSVVESIVSVCAKNGVKCIAEGVQSENHVNALIEVGCTYAQGYYYGKPMPIEDFTNRFLIKSKQQEDSRNG